MREGDIIELVQLILGWLAAGTRIISFCGQIGAGKTTALEEVERELTARGLRVMRIVEQRPEITFQQFLKDKRNAYRLQMAMLTSRATLVAEMLSALDAGLVDVVLWDRSVFEDVNFYHANVHFGNISADTWPEYEAQRAWAIKELGCRIAFVYIECTRARVHEQIKLRNRPGELQAYTTGDGPAYLDYLGGLYPGWLDKLARDGYSVTRLRNDTHRPELVQSAEVLDLRKSTSPICA